MHHLSHHFARLLVKVHTNWLSPAFCAGTALVALTACLARPARSAEMTVSSPRGTVTIEAADPELRISVSQGGKLIEIADQGKQWSVRLRDGIYEVAMQGGDDRLELSGGELTVRRGKTTRVSVKQSAGDRSEPRTEKPATAKVTKPASPKLANDAAADANSFAGTWQITDARNFGGEPYRGRVEVRISDNGLARLSWSDPSGQQVAQSGMGFVRDGHLLAAWGVQPDFGVMLYEIRDNGTLEGVWTHSVATQQLGKEVAKGEPGGLEGAYKVHGTSIAAGGGEYDGTLAIARRGDVYQASWDAAGSKFSGIGIREGRWLLIGWSMADGAPHGVVDYQLKGKAAVGRWTMVGQESLEPEILGRVDER
jgi:hypothetical protein